MSHREFVALPLETTGRDAWDCLASRNGTIFDSLRWTEIFAPALSRVGIYDAGGGLRGGFCVYEQKKLGLRILRNPPFTPYVGPFYEPRASNPAARTDEQRAVVEAMAYYLAKSGAAVVSLGLSLGITDCLPFFWRGYKVIPNWVYRVNLRCASDAIYAGMSTAQRKAIRKAQKDGFIVESTQDTGELKNLVIKNFERQRVNFPLNALDKIFRTFSYEDNSISFMARRSQDAYSSAGVFFIHDLRAAYGVISGYNHEESHSGAGTFALWQTILKAKEKRLQVLDFAGSVMPRIERYLRGFGGQLTPVFTICKAWLPIEMALKMRPRYRNRF